MKKREFSLPAIGGSSLLVIFAVLCLTVLELLTLSTVLAERRLSESAAEASAAYYRADTEAERIFARIRAGGSHPAVTETETGFCFAVAVTERTRLEVTVQRTDEGWEVLRWQTVSEEQNVDEGLNLWDGK